jgi:hypothetical protein
MKTISILVLIFSLFTFACGNIETDDFDVAKLSPQGQTAYQNLLNAPRFEQGLIGEGGELSPKVISLNILAKEKFADQAFKSLLENATLAGQLYALCGLFYTDYEFFKKSIENYRKEDELVEAMSGCKIFSQKVSEIIESKAENVAIISPKETIEDWWKKNKMSYELDIIHGGFPATFKYYKNGKL